MKALKPSGLETNLMLGSDIINAKLKELTAFISKECTSSTCCHCLKYPVCATRFMSFSLFVVAIS